MLQSGISQLVAVYAQPPYARRVREATQSVVGNLHPAQIHENASWFYQGLTDGRVAAEIVSTRRSSSMFVCSCVAAGGIGWPTGQMAAGAARKGRPVRGP
jgi:hypothetical protein